MAECDALQTINLDHLPALRHIGPGAFSSCRAHAAVGDSALAHVSDIGADFMLNYPAWYEIAAARQESRKKKDSKTGSKRK